MFDLKYSKGKKLSEEIDATANGHATVQLLTHKEALLIKDIDKATAAVDVEEPIALVTHLDVLHESIKLRRSYQGTQAAEVLLSATVAKKPLEGGRLIKNFFIWY